MLVGSKIEHRTKSGQPLHTVGGTCTATCQPTNSAYLNIYLRCLGLILDDFNDFDNFVNFDGLDSLEGFDRSDDRFPLKHVFLGTSTS